MALNDLYRRLHKVELQAAQVKRPISPDDLEPWQVFMMEMSPDQRDAFFDHVMNKTRHLTEGVTK